MEDFVPAADIKAAADYMRARTGYQPTVGIILGSGLSSLADALEQADAIPTADIPNWPTSTVSGHDGRVVLGGMQGKTVLVLQGRVHFYEGYTMGQIALPIRAMHQLGVRTLIVTNAAGGLDPSYMPGDLMLIRDHINFPGIAGHNPLRGPNDESLGPRFPDLTEPYSADLRRLARDVAADSGIELREGIYCYVGGPSFETPAELRFLQIAGGNAVGMSTAPETVTARHAGMQVLGISTITNMALPDPPPGTAHSHDEVLAAGRSAVPRLIAVVQGVVGRMP